MRCVGWVKPEGTPGTSLLLEAEVVAGGFRAIGGGFAGGEETAQALEEAVLSKFESDIVRFRIFELSAESGSSSRTSSPTSTPSRAQKLENVMSCSVSESHEMWYAMISETSYSSQTWSQMPVPANGMLRGATLPRPSSPSLPLRLFLPPPRAMPPPPPA